MPTTKITENLFLVDLDQQMEGFRHFISSWIYTAHDKVVIVDPGPSSTIPVLVNAIKKLGISRVDYILLTHIHIDHAGGSGILSSHFPQAKVICYEKAIAHMINPDQLWQMSKKILGEIADIYGPIAAVQRERISYPDKIIDGALKIDIIETPGHAPHHVNYLIDGILFAGEVAGVIVPANNFYLRIATPLKFIYSVYKNSLHKAAQIDCDIMCFGHYGFSENTKKIFTHAGEQLQIWMDTTRRFFENGDSDMEENIFTELLMTDSNLKEFTTLPADITKREKYFSLNSIKGMLGFLENQKYNP